MNKYTAILFFSLLFISCKEEEITPINVKLIAGTWEVVESDTSERGCIYEIATISDNSDSGYYGTITTFYYTVAGTPLYDKIFTWSICELESPQPLLKLTLVTEPDDKDPLKIRYYNITKLNSTHMWWSENNKGEYITIKFQRMHNLYN